MTFLASTASSASAAAGSGAETGAGSAVGGCSTFCGVTTVGDSNDARIFEMGGRMVDFFLTSPSPGFLCGLLLSMSETLSTGLGGAFGGWAGAFVSGAFFAGSSGARIGLIADPVFLAVTLSFLAAGFSGTAGFEAGFRAATFGFVLAAISVPLKILSWLKPFKLSRLFAVHSVDESLRESHGP